MGENGKRGRVLDKTVLEAAKSPEKTDALIRANEPYIRSRVSRYASGSSGVRIDELLSVGMMAFFEAIKTYREDKGHFYPFADLVIRRRIIDEFRKNVKSERAEMLNLLDEDETDGRPQPLETVSMGYFRESSVNEALLSELEEYKEKLAERGIRFEDLAKHSPKHKALRAVCRDAIETIVNDDGTVELILNKKGFPIKRVSEITGLPQKKLERLRIYIIAVIIILTGDYDYLSEYVPITVHASSE
jgi:RNA polymerase sigma factor